MKTRNVDQFVFSGNQAEVLELDDAALSLVNGGDFAMGFAGGLATTITSIAVGAVIGGMRGAMIGGAAGFALGVLITIGYHLATGGGGPRRSGHTLVKGR